MTFSGTYIKNNKIFLIFKKIAIKCTVFSEQRKNVTFDQLNNTKKKTLDKIQYAYTIKKSANQIKKLSKPEQGH